jgi:hypothetical protein
VGPGSRDKSPRGWVNIEEQNNMVDRSPHIDEAVQAIKASGSYQIELTAQNLEGILTEVVSSLIKEQESVRASEPVLNARIENAKGIVNGSVEVKKPIQAVIKVYCALANDTAPGRIRLAGLDIQQEAAFTARLALKAVNIEGKVREALQDPNRILWRTLNAHLATQGVKLTGLGLHFTESTLAVHLEGEPALSNR